MNASSNADRAARRLPCGTHGARRWLLVASVFAAGAGAFGCGAAPPRSPGPRATEQAPTVPLVDDRWGRFRSPRLGLSVPLPDGTAWKIDDHSSPWLVARHAETQTLLRARVWLEPRPVSRASCEASARRWAPDLPATREQNTIDDITIVDTPAAGFETRVIVGLHEPASDGSAAGHVLAFGVSGRKCVALAFTTRAQGSKGSAELGTRLELGARIVEGTILSSGIPRGPLAGPSWDPQ